MTYSMYTLRYLEVLIVLGPLRNKKGIQGVWGEKESIYAYMQVSWL